MFVFVTTRALRSFVASNQTNRLLPKLLTIDDFFSKIIDTSSLKFIDKEHRFLLLKKATQIKEFHQLGLSNQFNDFLNHSEYLFRFFTELSSEKVSIETLQEVDTYEFYKNHLDILKTIQHNYLNSLKQHDLVDKISLPMHYKLNIEFIQSFEQIEIFFEGYFTQFEFELIQQVCQYTTVIINLKTNEYNKKSYKKFEVFDFELQTNRHYRLNLTQRTILMQTVLDTKKNLKALKAFNLRINQIAFVKHSIYEMIQQGIAADNIVVIVPDESFTSYLQLFDKQRYFNYAMGKSIETSFLYAHAHALYGYLNEKEHKQYAYIDFIELSIPFIQEEFEPFFNKNITQEHFEKLIAFLIKQESNQEILEKFEEKVYALKRLLFTYDEPIRFKEAFKFLLQKIQEITLDDTSGGKVTVMGLLETRGLCFDGVVIVDFNEEVVPKRSIKDKFLSTKVKHIAKLPTLKDRENLQKYYYERLCSGAKALYVSCVHNESNQVSRFAHELFNYNAIESKPTDALYENILYQAHTLQHTHQTIQLNINLAQFKWSASRLKTFLTCKRAYYLKYILGLKEHTQSLKPRSFELGSYIHKVLEEFYTIHKQVLPTMNDTILNDYFNLSSVKNPYLLLDLAVWQKRLETFIQKEKEDFLTQKEVFKTEFNFEFEYQGITLQGVIDRVDLSSNALEIIDYKTSSSLKVDSIKTYETSKDFQLAFYYLAMKAFLHKNPKYAHLEIEPYYYDLYNVCKVKESVLDEKLQRLDALLNQLYTTTVNFEQTNEQTACHYCSYKTICER
jgi:inactivated superfamily I helicase/RecB family exonuclease